MAGNWYALLGMIDEAREIDKRDREGPPVTCPNDYTTLEGAANGKLFCPWDGWVWPDDA